MRESQQEHSLARSRESRQLEEWPLESMASVCQRQFTKIKSAWGKETFLCSSGFSGSRGGVDSGKSFASQSLELRLCCVRELDVDKNPNENHTGEEQRDRHWLAACWIVMVWACSAAALPCSVMPLVRKELIAARQGGSLPGRTLLVDTHIGVWMLESRSKNAWFRVQSASNSPFLLLNHGKGDYFRWLIDYPASVHYFACL